LEALQLDQDTAMSAAGDTWQQPRRRTPLLKAGQQQQQQQRQQQHQQQQSVLLLQHNQFNVLMDEAQATAGSTPITPNAQ
jgi:hypothetical protein